MVEFEDSTVRSIRKRQRGSTVRTVQYYNPGGTLNSELRGCSDAQPKAKAVGDDE